MLKIIFTLNITIVLVSSIECIKFLGIKHAIVNGFNKPIEPNENEFPHQASLVAELDGSKWKIFCGGSLIHPIWILTAAHCLEQDGKQFPTHQIKVSFGSVYSDLRGGQVLNVSRLIIHEKYYESEGNHDIGLIKLNQSVVLSKTVKIIELHFNNSENLLGEIAYLTGMGIVNDFYKKPIRLRQAMLHVNSPNRCSITQQYQAYQLCGTSTITEGKACKGDSGGPLVIKREGSYIQVGVTSHLAILPICKLTFNHSVYMKVAAYIKWIYNKTGIVHDNEFFVGDDHHRIIQLPGEDNPKDSFKGK